MVKLAQDGHIVGLIGNWGVFVQQVGGWQRLVSFFNLGVPKAEYMVHFARYVPAEEYVMVGNILGVSGSSDDQGEAARAGWRFIREADFAAGIR